jgi:hypothetical protein
MTEARQNSPKREIGIPFWETQTRFLMLRWLGFSCPQVWPCYLQLLAFVPTG